MSDSPPMQIRYMNILWLADIRGGELVVGMSIINAELVYSR